ncbi:MAG TPA: hypothetical protein VHH34_17795, partial [Pseudonocardiaceae bacterium]|nr:hypothetical protein [Pseudonocardiaceae bacterium]
MISNPQQWLLSKDDGVTVLLAVSRAGAVLSGLVWPWIERLARDRNGKISQSRLLLVVTLLPVPLLPTLWVAQALWPSLGMLLLPFTVAAVLTGWARTPMSVWTRGPVGASLNNTARIAAVPLAQLIDGALIGGFADAIDRMVRSGTDYSALVDTAMWRLMALSVPVSIAPLLVAVMIRGLRVAPLPDLQPALERAGATPAQAGALIEHLSAGGVRDVGTLRAVLFDEWRPRIAPGLRQHARAHLQDLLGLSPEQVSWLDAARRALTAPDEGAGPGSVGRLRAVTWWVGRSVSAVAGAARSVRSRGGGTRGRGVGALGGDAGSSSVGAALVVAVVVGVGVAVRLVVGSIVVGLAAAAVAVVVVVAVRALTGGKTIRAPTGVDVVAAGRAVRAAITLVWWDTLSRFERASGFRFADVRARIVQRYWGLPTQLSPSWWWFSARMMADGVRAGARAVVAAVRGRPRPSGEYRYYPTWLQELLERLHPGLGAWFYEFLHLKLRRQAPGGAAPAIPAARSGSTGTHRSAAAAHERPRP